MKQNTGHMLIFDSIQIKPFYLNLRRNIFFIAFYFLHIFGIIIVKTSHF